jgi:ribonucleoside-diphosphate reductase alpha chain
MDYLESPTERHTSVTSVHPSTLPNKPHSHKELKARRLQLVKKAVAKTQKVTTEDTSALFEFGGKFIFQDAPYNESSTRIYNLIQEGFYDQRLTIYNKEDIDTACSYIVPKRDELFQLAGSILMSLRYLRPNEYPQEVFVVQALMLAIVEPEEDRLRWVKLYYDLISKQQVSLATPILANLRFPHPSTYPSCYVIPMYDSLEEIMQCCTNMARISKAGGGVGINLSNIRAAGAPVMGLAGKSNGVLAWMKIINSIAVAVDQGGKRAGACTVALDIWHYDILDFLASKYEHGDQRVKCHDLFPQVVLPDLFLEKYEMVREQVDKNKDNFDEDWYLFDPYTVKQATGYDLPNLTGREFKKAYHFLIGRIKSRGLLKVDVGFIYKKTTVRIVMKEIIRGWLERGLPYIFYKDTANEANPNKHEGIILSSNLCTESYSVVTPTRHHTCNLISVNLANCLTVEEVQLASYYSVRMLDNVIDLNTPAFQESQNHNETYRVVGVGTVGLADHLATLKKKYNVSQDYINKLYEHIALSCYECSVTLAEERGAYPAYSGSEWSKGIVLNKTLKEMSEFSPCWEDVGDWQTKRRWTELYSKLSTHGIRNSQCMAIAPNTSSSLVQSASPSIWPIYKTLFYNAWKEGVVRVAPKYLDESYWFYQEAWQVGQDTILEIASIVQKWVDTGISLERVYDITIDPDTGLPKEGAVVMAKSVLRAWKLGLKALYYSRTVNHKQEEGCSSCAN